ncbi:MAG: delta-60 repeat domain-containing protein, partial [Ginsengibacter sp.]
MKKLLPLLFFLLNVSANAQDGALDLSFGTSGVAKKNLNPPKGATTLNATDISKIVVQNDGKILQVGYKGSSTGDDFVIIRYNYDGSPDASFGTQAGGWTVTDINGKDDRAHGVAIQNDGKIIIAGETIIGVKTAFAVARYNPDGKTLDNTFGTNGLVVDLNSNPSGANSVTMQPDGKILVAGWGKENTTNDFVVTRYNTDGSFDNSFDTDGKLFTDFASGNDAATDIHFLNDGTNRILVAGYETNGPNTYFALAMYNNDGTLNAAFNGGKVVSTFTGSGRSVDIAADGKVYVTGLSNSTGNYDYTTESFNPDGTLNTFFNGSGIVKTNLGSVSDASRSVKLQCDGKILVGGEFNDPATSRYSYAVVRYNPDGSLDNSFNGNGKSIVNTGGSSNDYDYGFCGLALQDGKILMGGVSFPPPVSLAGRIYFNPTIIRLQNNTATAGNITPATA